MQLTKNQPIEAFSPDDPFKDDVLGRESLAKELTELIGTVLEGESYVLSVNGPWGSGKTMFLRMWHAFLLSKGHPALYYNAWTTDYVDDPLAAFIGELERGIGKESTGLPAKSGNTVKKLASAGATILRKTGPIAVQLATQGLIKSGDVEGGWKALLEGHEGEIGKAASEIAKQQLAAFGAQRDAVEDFRQQLTLLVEEASTEGKNTPMVIFLDELDRCRPTFAIELLERVKHLFEVPGLVFILGNDREQLAHSVKAVYGEGFDAVGYLRRFVDLEIRLPEPEPEGFSRLLIKRMKIAHLDDRLASDFAMLAELFGLPLRSQEQCFTEMAAVAGAKFSYRAQKYLAFLCAFRAAEPEKYQLYRTSAKSLDQAMQDMGLARGQAKTNHYYQGAESILSADVMGNIAQKSRDVPTLLDRLDSVMEYLDPPEV